MNTNSTVCVCVCVRCEVQCTLCSHVHSLDVGHSCKDPVPAVAGPSTVGQERAGRLPQILCRAHQLPQPIIQLSNMRTRERVIYNTHYTSKADTTISYVQYTPLLRANKPKNSAFFSSFTFFCSCTIGYSHLSVYVLSEYYSKNTRWLT